MFLCKSVCLSILQLSACVGLRSSLLATLYVRYARLSVCLSLCVPLASFVDLYAVVPACIHASKFAKEEGWRMHACIESLLTSGDTIHTCMFRYLHVA